MTDERKSALSPEMEPGTEQKGHGGNAASPSNSIAQNGLKVKLNLDSKPYSSKADAKREIGIIRNRLKPYTIDPAALPKGICSGYTFTPAVLNGTTAESWESQALWCVDIDNDDGHLLTPSEAMEIMAAAGIYPLFIYYSFSHTPEKPKFRIVVMTTETVTDFDKAQRMREGLLSLFPGSDKACADAARMFLGTNKGMAVDYTGYTVPADALEALYFERVEPEQVQVSAEPLRMPYTTDLTDAIERFDLAGYIEQTTGSRAKRMGGQVRFNPCPICGHDDDFDVRGNVFTCRSASGLNGQGGNIINYLEAVNGWDRKTAREYFMYDILGWDRVEARTAFKEQKRVERVERVTHEPAKSEVPEFVIEKRDKNGEVTSTYISAPILAQHIREREHYIFTRGGAMSGVNRFWYSGGYYRHVSDDEIRGIIKGYVERYDYTLLRMKDVNEVFQQLITDRVFHDDNELNAQENLINFLDGVLDINTMELHPHSPEYLMTRQIPVKWDTPDREPETFHRYMRYLCDGTTDMTQPFTDAGAERYTVLMQFLGACVSNVRGYRFKKALFMYGPGDTGKSQLKSLAESMIGAENCCPCDLGQLEARFGTSAIFNKRLIGSSDMPFMTVDELDTFKQVTGGDNLFAEYKGKNGFHFVFDGLAWFCMNRLPRFGGDQGEWVYNRIIPVECPHVVPDDMKDRELLDKMKAEAPAIIRESLYFLRVAISDGYKFAEPSDAVKLRKEYREDNDTVAAWIADCCIEVANPQGTDWATVAEWQDNHDAPSVSTMYKLYKEWCREYENGYTLKMKDFKAAIISQYGEPEKRRSGYVFRGICLNEKTAKSLNTTYYGGYNNV